MSVTAPSASPISAAGYVPQTRFGAVLIEAMWPWMTLHLAWYCDAIGAMVDPLYELVMDQGDDNTQPTVGTLDEHGSLIIDGYRPGYGILLDPTSCPLADLPYLGQFVGVQVPVGSDEQTARSLVFAESGRNRGTPGAVIAAAKRNLTGTQSVTYIERKYIDGTPSPGWAGLIMRRPECPSLQAVKDAVEHVKFGGILMWYQLVDGYTWAQQTRRWSEDTRTWADAAGEL